MDFVRAADWVFCRHIWGGWNRSLASADHGVLVYVARLWGAFITAVILLWRSRYGGDLSDAAVFILVMFKSTWGHIYGNTFHHGLIVITADLIETLLHSHFENFYEVSILEMVEFGYCGDLNFVEPKVGPVCHFPLTMPITKVCLLGSRDRMLGCDVPFDPFAGG
ncbi:hypothetical protein HAX54_006367 [Datura stramonium]|uniref:Uncharacterized protein n=1 Tax=Datura stramonium TaxID=4076 RepID=A0ABS8TBU6_DATST|nr:hypothetical protein [Datura stramonium]